MDFSNTFKGLQANLKDIYPGTKPKKMTKKRAYKFLSKLYTPPKTK